MVPDGYVDTRVICFGNEWHGDDGVGMRVYEVLSGRDLPDGVALHAAGTTGLSGAMFFEDCRRAIVIDALCSNAEPGSVHRLRRDDAMFDETPMSNHALGLGYLLRMLPTCLEPADVPEVVIFGVQVESIEILKRGLSPHVERAVSATVERVLAEAARQPELA